MTGLPDTSEMQAAGPYRGIDYGFDVKVAGFSFHGTHWGWALDVTKEIGIPNVSGSITGRFDKGASLYDVNIEAKASLSIPTGLSDIGLGSGISVEVSGDAITASLTVYGQALDVEVRRGSVEDHLLRALEEILMHVTGGFSHSRGRRTAARMGFSPTDAMKTKGIEVKKNDP